MLSGLDRVTLQIDGPVFADITHGNADSLRDGYHAGKGAQPLVHLAIEFLRVRFVVACLLRVHHQIEDVVGIETQIQTLRPAQAAREQSRHDHQKKRSRHLSDYQGIPYEIAAPTFRRRAAALMKHHAHIGARSP
jgi:hypothetical protein